jgi:hypothetical protein
MPPRPIRARLARAVPKRAALALPLLAALLAPVLAPSPAAAQYYVYCINGRISTEQWDLAQMRTRHGSNVCQFGQFGFASDADNFAQRNFGGKGASCSCR